MAMVEHEPAPLSGATAQRTAKEKKASEQWSLSGNMVDLSRFMVHG